jgi:hypothetical protein
MAYKINYYKILNMKLSLTIYLIISLHYLASTQNIIVNPPILENFDRDFEWSSIVDNQNTGVENTLFTEDKYNLSINDAIIVEDKVLQIYKNGINSGTYISLRDLSTGNRIWEKSININESDKFEIYNSSFLENDEVTIIGWRLISSNPNSIFPIGTSVKRIYDVNTGSLISHSFPALEKAVFSNNPNPQYFRLSGNRYTSFVPVDNNLGAFFQMNNELCVLDTVLVEYQHPENNNNYQSSIIQTTNGHLVLGTVSYNELSELNSFKNDLIFYDQDLNKIKSIDVANYLHPATIAFELVETGGRIVLIGRNFNEDNSRNNSIVVMDLEGNIIESYKNEDLFLGFTKGIYHDQENIYTFLSSDGNSNCFRHITINDDVEQIEFICHSDDSTSVAPLEVFANFNSAILNFSITKDTTITESNGNLRDINVPFQGILNMNLPNITSTNSNTFINDPMILPNPSNGIFQIIQSADTILKYNLYNVEGKLMGSGITNRIDISLHPSGVYYLKADKSNRVFKLVKI